MSSTSYMPGPDSQALVYMHTFADGLTASPATYGVTAADALAVTNAVNAFQAAFDIAADPATRTPVSINNKDEARVSAEQIIRQFYGLIKPNAGISDGAKIAIGVRPVNPGSRVTIVPSMPPSTPPTLTQASLPFGMLRS